MHIVSLEVIKTIEIYNLLGDKVVENSGENAIDISNLDAGIYMVKITGINSETATKKIIKE